MTNTNTRTNARGANCDKCGRFVKAGNGRLYQGFREESPGVEDYESPIWKVDCLDGDDCKAAMEARRKEHAEAQAKTKEIRSAKLELFKLDDLADSVERPDSIQFTEIENSGTVHVFDKNSIPYGGGSWAVLGQDGLWLVQNNGHDGDDWSYNNVRTWGAGAVGRKLLGTKVLERASELLKIIEENKI